MNNHYKRLGDYIQLVDERNRDNAIGADRLLAININKQFMPSVANVSGTDLSKYKVISKGQFACSLMQVRRNKKIPVALLKDFDEAIISQAYPVFKIVDTEELLPAYLMMWMSRSEFDREACFYAVGGVRGSLEWEDLCNMEFPVPSIEKQREIVKEYHTIVDRINLNEQLNQKLEETAQGIYKQWFVDFEFPVDSPPAEGWQAKPDGVVPFKRDTKAYRSLPYNPKLKDRAKALRKAGVLSEVIFWQQVHKKKFKGLDFDRQKIIGNYIVDFYCPNLNVVVEIDGSSHNDKQEYDAERDAYLKGLGLTVIHIKDIDVKRNLQDVMDYLREHEAFQMDCSHAENNHPTLRAPLQRRGIGYKSSGGEMVWNDELDQEIPRGWSADSLSKLMTFKNGKSRPNSEGEIPIYGGNGVLGFTNQFNSEDVIAIGRVGAYCGSLFRVIEKCWISDNAICAESISNQNMFCFYTLKSLSLNEKSEGTGQPLLTQGILNSIVTCIPRKNIIVAFENVSKTLFAQVYSKKKELELLYSLNSVILSKMSMSGTEVTA